MSERILIVGAGHVGAALGLKWLACGHDVHFGVPDPQSAKYHALPREKLRVATGPVGARIVVLAVPYAAAAAAVAGLGELAGVILIDCTNPLGIGPAGLQLLLGHDASGAEEIAMAAPRASVFKTLNQTGAENMSDAEAYHPSPVMFVAGDDEAAKPLVMNLVRDLSFEAINVGPLRAARLSEPFAML